MKKVFLIFLSAIMLLSFNGCSGKLYIFDIKTENIKEIYIDIGGAYKVEISSGLWEDFLTDLNALNFKSYFYDIRSETNQKIYIVDKNDENIIISPYRILNIGNHRYSCDYDEYTNLLERYNVEPVYYNFDFTAEDILNIKIVEIKTSANNEEDVIIPQENFTVFYNKLAAIDFSLYFESIRKDNKYYFTIDLLSGEKIFFHPYLINSFQFKCDEALFNDLLDDYVTI